MVANKMYLHSIADKFDIASKYSIIAKDLPEDKIITAYRDYRKILKEAFDELYEVFEELERPY